MSCLSRSNTFVQPFFFVERMTVDFCKHQLNDNNNKEAWVLPPGGGGTLPYGTDGDARRKF